MNDASFASLSPTLLARKGGARPAMRPQHGGLLGSIGSGSGQDLLSEEGLDDLGWNDMGDEHPAHHDADIIKLTPSPANEQIAAQTRQLDEQAGARLAEFSGSKIHAREQQNVLAKRMERTSPPILSDAIMSNDDDGGVETDELGFGSEVEFETESAADHYAGPDGLHSDADSISAHKQVSSSPAVIAPKVMTAKPRSARIHRVAAADQGKRAAFTLRLDAERHLQLRLASTISGRSAQQIVTDALDAFLAGMPELASLAAQVKRPGNENS